MFFVVFSGLTIAFYGGLLYGEWCLWGALHGWTATWPLVLALAIKGLFIVVLVVPTVSGSAQLLLKIVNAHLRTTAARQARAAYSSESKITS
jgi:hypothetical protein